MLAIFTSFIARLRGKQTMRRSSVVICCLARNAEGGLQRNIPRVEQLRRLFKSSRVIIVENDSTDGTKDLLCQWNKSAPDVCVLSCDTGVETIKKSAPPGISPYFSCHRISRMAGFRNQYLEELEKGIQPDFLIALDIDVGSFSVAGICHSFGATEAWDALFANGTHQGGIYYDTYALREPGDETPQTQAKIDENQRKLRGMRRGDSLQPVASAFGGLGIYRYPAIKGLRYRADNNPGCPDGVEVLVEHESIHKDMRMRGHGRLFINPEQRVEYQYAPSWLKRKVDRIRRIPAKLRRLLGF